MAATKTTQIQIHPSVLHGCVLVVPYIGNRPVISYTVEANQVEAHPLVKQARKTGLPVHDTRGTPA